MFGTRRFELQHSPSNRAESKFLSEMFNFKTREGFRKNVGRHVFGRTIDKFDFAGFTYPSEEVIAYVYMLRSTMELIVLGERNSQFVVRKYCSRVYERLENLSYKLSKPNSFFSSMYSRNGFRF